MTDTFVKQDNLKRLSKYQKSTQVEDSLLRINKALEPYEVCEKSINQFPTIFIFGLPRSGTTLTYQLLAYCLDLAYINNLIARFWLAPLHGIMLSKSVLSDTRDGSFTSDYGKSVYIHGPHEFAYFWQHWLRITSINDMLKFGVSNPKIKWNELGNVVNNIQDLFGKGIVFKTNYVANYLKDFSQTFCMPIFIYVERNPLDVGLSILRARMEYYGNYDSWWATYPPEYESLKSLPFQEQIASQIFSLHKVYEAQLNRIDRKMVIRIDYKQLCESPERFLHNVMSRIKNVYDFKVDIINTIPFELKSKDGKTPNSLEEEAVYYTIQNHMG